MVAGWTLVFSLLKGPPEELPRYTLYPTTDDELGFQLRSTECTTGVAPEPVNDAVVGELIALLTNETEPPIVPLA